MRSQGAPTLRFPAGDPHALAEVEARLALMLSGEGGRCAFLRSHKYLQFRMAALYRTRSTTDPIRICTPSGVWLEYTPDPTGGYITICSALPLFSYADP